MNKIKPGITDPLCVTADESPPEPYGMVPPGRQYSTAFKRDVVDKTLNGNDPVSVVARRYNYTANMLLQWRREYSKGCYSGSSQPLIPVLVDMDPVLPRSPE